MHLIQSTEYGSQSHRIFRIRRNHWRLSNLTPLLECRVTYSRFRTMFSLVLCISTDGVPMVSLCWNCSSVHLCCMSVLGSAGLVTAHVVYHRWQYHLPLPAALALPSASGTGVSLVFQGCRVT